MTGERRMDYRRLAAPVLERIFGDGTVSGLSEWELLERDSESATRSRSRPWSRGMVRW